MKKPSPGTPPPRRARPTMPPPSPNEEPLRLLVENIGDVLWFKQLDPPRFTYVSPAFERVWGLSQNDLLASPHHWDEGIHPDDREAVREQFHQWLAGTTDEYQVHYRVRNQDGQIRWLADRAIVLDWHLERPRLIGGIARDITDKEAAEAVSKRLAAVVESSDDSIIIMSLEGVIETWNQGAERIFGYTAEQTVGRTMSFLRPPEAEDDEAVFKRLIQRGQRIDHYETRRRHKDGRILDISLTISPLIDAAGSITGFSKISRDITERKQAEQTIIRLNAELEQRVEERTTELRTQIAVRRQLEEEILRISEREQRRIGQDLHDDLGQQLAGAWMMADVISRRLAAQGAAEHDAAHRLCELIGRSLNHTRALARGLHPVAPEQGGFVAALQDLALRSQDLFSIRCEVEAEKDLLIEDQTVTMHLYRIAQEALSNAVRHGCAQQVRIRLSRSADQAILRISDDGTGLQKKASSPTGMGTRIMQHRAEIINGSLRISNAPKKGACVTCIFPLPLIDPAPPPLEPHATSQQPPSPTKKARPSRR
jgi:PAS domain S-box-containing protein